MTRPRTTWPDQEWEQWRRAERPSPHPDDEFETDVQTFDVGEKFERELREALNKMVRRFIEDRCNERRLGSPELRLLARVPLWKVVERVAEEQMIASAAACRESGVPWIALSEVGGYKGPTNFKQRWGKRVETALAQRSVARERGLIPYGDPDNE